jgi:hypothetical protein
MILWNFGFAGDSWLVRLVFYISQGSTPRGSRCERGPPSQVS